MHTKFPALALKNDGVEGVDGVLELCVVVETGTVNGIMSALVFDRSSFL